MNPIIDLAYLISVKIGIGSYAIAKYRMQMRGGWEFASSGRAARYSRAIDSIKEHPWFGNSLEDSLQDGEYVHNLFLQVGQDLGVIILIAFVVLLLFICFRMLSKNTVQDNKIVLCILFSISIGRLLFSSTLWKRPEFWLMLFFYFSLYKTKENSMGGV